LPTFGVAEQICTSAATFLARNGVELTKNMVKKVANKAITSFKGKGNKAELKREIDMIVNKAAKLGKASNSALKMNRAMVTNAPVAKSLKVRRQTKPMTRQLGNGVVITHTEMISTVLTGTPSSNVTAFHVDAYRINPGVPSVFPWLSSVAVNYEKYRFKKLVFCGIPLVATNTSGRYGIGMDYDSTDAAPATRQEFYALSHQVEAMPWDPVSIDIPVDSQYRFTGTHTVSDSKLIDLGQILVMSDSISNGGTISAAFNLFDCVVSYEVELIQPQQALFASQTFATNTPLTVGLPLGTGVDLTSITGPQIVSRPPNPQSTSGITVYLPYGSYVITGYATWSSGTATATVTAGTSTTVKGNSAAGASFALYTIWANVTAQEGSVSLNVGTVTWTTSLTKLDLTISRVSPPSYVAAL